MGSMGALRVLAATALVAVACGSAHGVATSPTTASGARTFQCPTFQLAPRFQPPALSNRNLAIVWFKGPQGQYPRFAVRDITDILHPSTVSTFENVWGLQFVNASELFRTDGRLIRMSLSGSSQTVVASCADWAAWNPDGTSAAYINAAYFYSTSQQAELHLVTAGRNRIADTMPRWATSGCESRMCGERYGGGFTYSPNGAYISLVKDLAGQGFRIWDSDGKLLKSIDTAFRSDTPREPVWSGNTFYWRDDKVVEMWRDGVQSLLLAGLAWIHPNDSPAGGQILFQTRAGAGTAHVHLLDTISGKAPRSAKSTTP